MKKQLLIIFAGLLIASCTRTADEVTTEQEAAADERRAVPNSLEASFNRLQKPVGKYWIAEGYYVNGLSILPECLNDNELFFRTNLILFEPEGATKCNPDGSDTADFGGYNLIRQSGRTFLTLDTWTFPGNALFLIDTLTPKRFVAKFKDARFGNDTITVRLNAYKCGIRIN